MYEYNPREFSPLSGTGRDDDLGGFGLGAEVSVDNPSTGKQCRAQEHRIKPIVEPSPHDLVDVEKKYLVNPRGSIKLHRMAYPAFVALKAAAERDGIPPRLLTIISGYRSVSHQKELWERALKKYGTPEQARKWVAPPGGSAHNTGRAIDFWLGTDISSRNLPALRATPAYHWLVCNAARFGFTPYALEPWHWEYTPPGSSPIITARAPGPRAKLYSVSLDARTRPRASRLSGVPLGISYYADAPRPLVRPSERLYKPSMPGGHAPGARPAVGGLVKREDQPPQYTLYLNIPLGSEAPAHPLTGVFVPLNYRPEPLVDLILYLRGFHQGAPSQSIDKYWDSRSQSHFDFREGINAVRKNVILVAPSLGPRSQAGRLMQSGGLDWYLNHVLTGLLQHGPHRGRALPPNIRNLILACHSGGGWPMRHLATSPSRYAAAIRECWGFDCLYNTGDEDAWAQWAAARPSSRLYIHFGSGGTAARSIRLRNKGVPNVFVEGKTTLAHNLVPKAHWQERLRAASFLSDI
jgi:LAS superfamily LD-carboxypeptidase LdcB